MSDAATPPKKKSKLLLIALGTLLLAGGAAGTTWYVMGGSHHEAAAEKKEPPKKPLYTTLETFTVNLQDPRGERFAQVGVTLQFEDPELEMKIKDRLPAIRNEILLLLSSKEMEDLLSVEGKQQLAEQIRERSALALGIPVVQHNYTRVPPAMAAASAASGAAAPAALAAAETPKAEGGTKVAGVENPIRGVLFSQFIVQ
ncbi:MULTISPECIES: flagellar basal body-associated FliL family protein [Ramlibacter]|uniref:Flagellar protein FliL n=1 Tax=Ramlibacter aquaticus TaxID=2780094 RepID=A0ABR9SAW0_9BURK|nr:MULTISPECIES: flagellar basal body-associated FliL family protein [Ramlibacter]MBE7939217.1 flagellar basal body-associated FliL family protein [Ramlibacter aquaticus]